MCRVLLFGGTTEGRALAEYLLEQGIPSLVCVATDYGSGLVNCAEPVRVRAGRLDEAGMDALMACERPCLVLDATHPYALKASQNIRSACAARQVRYIRLKRESLDAGGCLSFSCMQDLVHWLNGAEGMIFSALGAKEAEALCAVMDYKERVFLRLLPSAESIAECARLGYPMKHICCMQGPFSKEFNLALFKETGASILLTKESGSSGGFLEKVSAAKECGMTVAVLARPREEGVSLEEAKAIIREACR